METKRAQTLEALETFIQAQKALLNRTQSDIKRLHELKGNAIADPSEFLSNLAHDLDANGFRLSDQVDMKLALPDSVEWGLFDGRDPKHFQMLAINSRKKYAQRNLPHPHQRSPLSDLQKIVKDARRTIVDPVLARFEYMSEPEEDPEDKSSADLEEIRRERERERLRKLKKRRIQSTSGLKLPARGLSGVFIRRDVDDESHEVDITLDDPSVPGPALTLTYNDATNNGAVYTSPTPRLPSPAAHQPKVNRTRRPSVKIQGSGTKKKASHTSVASRQKSKVSGSSSAANNPEPEGSAISIAPSATRLKSTNKPKPETYKQAWSVSEQHLLEQLLEQIPDGEKNRWQKISRAMEGRRTPRQVASRVQKYFEKLKRFGVVDG